MKSTPADTLPESSLFRLFPFAETVSAIDMKLGAMLAHRSGSQLSSKPKTCYRANMSMLWAESHVGDVQAKRLLNKVFCGLKYTNLAPSHYSSLAWETSYSLLFASEEISKVLAVQSSLVRILMHTKQVGL